jgi:hypothetical protein
LNSDTGRDDLRMAARLASFRGPSTPSSSPVKQAKSPTTKSTPTQAAKSTESTYHRKLRASLQDLRAACHTWDDLVRKDGLRAVRELIDARTDLECVRLFPVPNTASFNARCGPLMNSWLLLCSNMLSLVPDGEQPRSRIVGQKLSYMDERIAAIDLVISKLVRCAFSALTPVCPLSV